MIKAFSASPKTFAKPSLEKVGQGTGASRYAFGLYFGEYETASYYLNQYKSYDGAELLILYKDDYLDSASISYEVAKYIVDNNYDEDLVKEAFKDNDAALKALEYLMKDNSINFSAQRGALYHAEIRNVDLNDFKNWDELVGEYDGDSLMIATAEKLFDITTLKNKFTIEESTFIEYKDELFSLAIKNAESKIPEEDEEDCDDFIFDESEFKIIWDNILFHRNSDNYDVNSFYALIDEEFIQELDQLSKFIPEIDEDSTYGDAYSIISATIRSEQQANEKEIGLISGKILSKSINCSGFICKSMYGRKGAKEIVVTDDVVINSIKVSLVVPGQHERELQTDEFSL